jgi:hypothetical protein
MKDFRLNEKGYQMPTCWNDMDLKKYVELAKLEEAKESFGIPELYLLKVLEVLCGVEEGELDDLTLDLVNELSSDFVNIIAYGGPDGKTELAEYPVNYDELDLITLKSIDDVINDYEYGE